MANTDAPIGLKPVMSLLGDSSPQNEVRCFIPASDATATFLYDPVSLAGSGDTAGTAPTVKRYTGTGAMVGVIVSIEPLPLSVTTSDDLTTKYRAASTAMYVLVNMDPNLVCEMQEDSVGAALAVTNIGQNATIIMGAGDTTTGISTAEIDSSTAATTATLSVKLLGLVDREDNAVGTNAKWLVKPNNHTMSGGTGTVGI